MKKWHTLLLAIWLIANGVIHLFNISFTANVQILAILEILAGVLLILAGKKVKLFHHLGSLLLAIFLILQGVFFLFNIDFAGIMIIIGALAIAAGILMLMGMKGAKISQSLGILFLAIWLILNGLIFLIRLSFSGSALILSILAIVSGIFLILKRD
jgi:hypothetical protein